jgi:hypothetical protein
MPRRNDIKKVLIIGSGPIVIGQACEFDYSGTQACKALRSLGFDFVLGACFDARGLAERLGVQTRHQRLFARMLTILAEDGVLAPDGLQWRVLATPPRTDADAACATCAARAKGKTLEEKP